MYFGGFLVRRQGSWALRLALRSTLTAVATIVAGITLSSTALSKLPGEISKLPGPAAESAQKIIALQGYIPWLGVPALVLGIAAMAFKPWRPVLAVLAAVASAAAAIAIVATLVGAMMPLYQQGPEMLDLGMTGR